MEQILINGPCTLSGDVAVQGAKNSSMKHVLMPLLTNDIFVLKNIPDIGSTRKLLELVILQGAHVVWEDNTVTVDTQTVQKPQPLPAELFYYTSGAIFLIPILTFRFGFCVVEAHPERTDTGGDKIGTREFSQVLDTLSKLGITYHKDGNLYHFSVDSLEPLNFEVPVRSFSASVNAVIAALFKTGTSRINNITGEADFDDTIKFLVNAGARITRTDNSLEVEGQAQLSGITFENMFDRHDFITLLSAALTTHSEITIHNVDTESMKLDCLMPTLQQIGISVTFKDHSCYVPKQPNDLKPAQIVAGHYPNFITEWQVLFSPLLTQISGTSSVVETIYSNRMRHWEELGKMGARYEFFTDPQYPETNTNPRAVNVIGPSSLQGAHVVANDLRSGAALVIAGLAAKGKTVIADIDHIHRGYERLVERLNDLGASIHYIE